MIWADLLFELGRLFNCWPQVDILLRRKRNWLNKTFDLIFSIQQTIQSVPLASPHSVIFFSDFAGLIYL